MNFTREVNEAASDTSIITTLCKGIIPCYGSRQTDSKCHHNLLTVILHVYVQQHVLMDGLRAHPARKRFAGYIAAVMNLCYVLLRQSQP
jgi:hypothetical protein